MNLRPTVIRNLAAAGMLVATAGATVAAVPAAPDCAVRDGVNAVACHLVGTQVRVAGTRMLVPQPGTKVSQRGLYTDGAVETTAAVSPAGILHLRSTDTRGDAITVVPTEGGGDECSYTNYKYTGKKLSGHTEYWYYRSGSAPSYIGKDSFVSIASAAGNTWERGTANCNGYRTDYTDLAVTYKGSLNEALDIDSDGTCQFWVNHKNSWGFKYMSKAGLIALTCTTKAYTSNAITDADIAVNTKYQFFKPGWACYSRYDLQSVLTHEIGHTLGMDDVSASLPLTMGGGIAKCSTKKRTLGAGDSLGIRRLY